MKTPLRFLFILLCAAIVSLPSLHAATITVMNTNDSGPGSLRQEMDDANNGDTINFDSSLNGGTITLVSGQLVVNKSLTIDGTSAGLTVNGNNASRVFHVTGGVTVTIARLTITRGRANGHGGGGIYNEGSTLTVRHCTISYNSAGSAGGGGIYNDGSVGDATLIVSNSTLDHNQSGIESGPGGRGGGINNKGGPSSTATLHVFNSALLNNLAYAILRTQTGRGGGICNGDEHATLRVSNSTLSGNRVISNDGLGGGIYNAGSGSVVTLLNSTLAGNESTAGGGIYSPGDGDVGNTIFDRSPIFGNAGRLASIGYNLSTDAGGRILNTRRGDKINTNPLLGPLQNNGGPTLTRALLPGSPAINAGNPNFVPPPDYDQRGVGFSRVVNGRIDIGSFEVQL